MCLVELLLEDDQPQEKEHGRVLLVSDDRAWFAALKHALDGIAMVRRMDPSANPDNLLPGAYDLVILDAPVDVPMESGVRELVRRVRRQQPSSRIILATDSPTWQRARESFRIGAQDYISKSHNKSKLLEDLRKHLQARGISVD